MYDVVSFVLLTVTSSVNLLFSEQKNVRHPHDRTSGAIAFLSKRAVM